MKKFLIICLLGMFMTGCGESAENFSASEDKKIPAKKIIKNFLIPIMLFISIQQIYFFHFLRRQFKIKNFCVFFDVRWIA